MLISTDTEAPAVTKLDETPVTEVDVQGANVIISHPNVNSSENDTAMPQSNNNPGR